MGRWAGSARLRPGNSGESQPGSNSTLELGQTVQRITGCHHIWPRKNPKKIVSFSSIDVLF